MVNQISDKEICPEEHRDEGSLFKSDEDSCPEEHCDARSVTVGQPFLAVLCQESRATEHQLPGSIFRLLRDGL